MTFEEAKKILEKEGFELEERPGKFYAIGEDFTEFEDPNICEAIQVVSSAGYAIMMLAGVFDARKARLKKELEKYGNAPMPGPGEEQPEGSVSGKLKCEAKLIGPLRRLNTETLGEQPKEKKGIIYPSTSPKDDFYYKHVLKEGNPALKESASQFNDTLLNEQAKKIKELTEDNENWKSWHEMQNRQIALSNIAFRNEKNRLGKEIVRLKKVIYKKNLKIEELKKESSEHLDGKVKYYGETVDLSQELCDKNEELRLSKIREKNLTELCQKYMKEIEELNEKAKSTNMYRHKELAEKDEVIADLGNELAATKKELEEKTQLVETVRKGSKEYCEYGVAANEFIKKLANLYVTAGNKGTISNEMFERCKNYQTYGFPATCNKETKKEIDDIARGKENKKPRIHTPEISEEELMKIQEKVVASCDIAEEGGDYSATIVQCGNGITLSKEEAEIIERCTKNGTELHYSEKDGFTYTNVFDKEMPIRCLRGMFHVLTDEEIKNMKK